MKNTCAPRPITTDIGSLKAMFAPGSIEWNQAQIERLKSAEAA